MNFSLCANMAGFCSDGHIYYRYFEISISLITITKSMKYGLYSYIDIQYVCYYESLSNQSLFTVTAFMCS